MNISSDELAAKGYEKFFRNRRSKGMTLDKIRVKGKFSVEEVSNAFHEWMKAHQRSVFTMLMRAEWLDRHISYQGAEKILGNPNQGQLFNAACKQFWSEFVGFNHSVFIIPFNRALMSYLDDFFPHYEEINPFDYDFPFPFEHMRLENLFLVSKLPERLELLREGERRQMNVLEFDDYVAAYMTEKYHTTGREWNMYDKQMFVGPRFVRERKTLQERLKQQLNDNEKR